MMSPTYLVRLLAAGFLAAVWLRGVEPATGDVLHTARQIRELNAATAAEARPAELTGVVLGLAEPEGLAFVIQDATDPLYILGPSEFVRTLKPGDEVNVRGHTDAGGFAPILKMDWGVKTGHVPIPEPRRVTSEDLFTKGLDAQWIVVTGLVRDVRPLRPSEIPRDFVSASGENPADRGLGPRLKMTLAVGDRLVPVQLYGTLPPEQYVDAEVEVSGLCVHQHNAERQFVNPLILIPPGVGLRVLQVPPAGPFDSPVIASSTLFQFKRAGLSTHRVRIAGVVLHQKPGAGLWLRDGDRGLFVETESQVPVRPGDRIEAAGFPERGEFSPFLAASVYRVTGAGSEPAPAVLTERVAAARHHGDLVMIEGTLVDDKRSEDGGVLRMDWQGAELEVHWAGPPERFSVSRFDPGAVLSVAGICLVSAERGAPLSGVLEPDKFRLLVRRPTDIVLRRAAPWWTPGRIAMMLAAVAVALAIVLAAVFIVSRRKLARERALRASKASEYAARLAERSRMARDIHDSVAQGLGAVSLQLQLAECGPLSGEQARHLGLARQLVITSLTEVRGFIRNLRTQAHHDGDLASVLEEQLRHAVDGAEIRPVFECLGEARKWPPPVEEQVVRIAQEAMANVVQHAGARTLSLHLRFTPTTLILTVTDDGRGFDPAADWARRGHFGLLGMRERAALIGATFEIDRPAAGGARVRLTVPAAARLADDFAPP